MPILVSQYVVFIYGSEQYLRPAGDNFINEPLQVAKSIRFTIFLLHTGFLVDLFHFACLEILDNCVDTHNLTHKR